MISEAGELKNDIIQALSKQGYRVNNGAISMPDSPSKDYIRALNHLAVQKKFQKSGPGLRAYEERLIKNIANGREIKIQEIFPKIILVKPGSENERIFRYACLHWSIPVSSGYGRRLRFLVFDQSNNKLIGLFGLGDPVYSMQARDNWIGWDKEMKAKRMYHIMDAYVLGAVPPYSMLLGGKLISMIVCSNEVRKAFAKKYQGQKTVIKQKIRPPYLCLVTTTSALGRSSIYNRIKVNGHKYWRSVGFTKGSGEFHFSNGVYDKICSYVREHCKPTAKHKAWGVGFRNKREVIKKCLQGIGLSVDLMYHGIHREIFVAPLGNNSLPFLRGESNDPSFFNWSVQDLFSLFSDRWLIGRANRMPQFSEYNREQYRLWGKKK